MAIYQTNFLKNKENPWTCLYTWWEFVSWQLLAGPEWLHDEHGAAVHAVPVVRDP